MDMKIIENNEEFKNWLVYNGFSELGNCFYLYLRKQDSQYISIKIIIKENIIFKLVSEYNFDDLSIEIPFCEFNNVEEIDLDWLLQTINILKNDRKIN